MKRSDWKRFGYRMKKKGLRGWGAGKAARLLARAFSCGIALALALLASAACAQAAKPLVGVAWVSDSGWEYCLNACIAIEEAGGEPVLLGQVCSDALEYANQELLSEYVDENGALTEDAARLVRAHGSNAQQILRGVSAVVFAGGEDISPSLYAQPALWHGIEAEKNYNAARDVSDYLLMDYCLDNDIAVLALCRGMQMMAVVSGAELIQDIPAYFAAQGKNYGYEHRNEKETLSSYRDYAAHDVDVTVPGSLLQRITGGNRLVGAPSWHHQAVKNVDGTPLMATGTTTVSGEAMIEAVERADQTFALGLQFHPEAAVVKHLDGAKNREMYMDYDTAMLFFEAIVQAAR